MNEFSRSELLLGSDGIDKLKDSNVAVFGVGGVGSFTVEALVRSGVGNIAIFDDAKVSLTNINRQLIATRKTVGKLKVEVMRDRILEINPKVNVEIHQVFYTKDNADDFDLSQYTYIVDAIDTVSAKLALIERAKKNNIPIISCMGAGNKLDPTRLEVTDIYSTSMCPLARTMRYELRKRAIDKLKVVYSREKAMKPMDKGEEEKIPGRRSIPGSVAFVPSVAGLIIAGELVRDMVGI